MKLNMTKWIAALGLAMLVCGTAIGRDLPEIRTAASDSRITYVGRTLKEGDNVSFDWTGVYVKVSFEGSYLSMIASDTKANYYDIWKRFPLRSRVAF